MQKRSMAHAVLLFLRLWHVLPLPDIPCTNREGERYMSSKRNNRSIAISVLVWGVAAALLSLLFSGLVAVCITNEVITQESIRTSAPVITALSVLTAAFLGAKSVPQNGRLIVALGTGGVYLLLCILAKLLFFREGTNNVMLMIVTCVLSAVVAAVLSGMKKERHKMSPVRRRR